MICGRRVGFGLLCLTVAWASGCETTAPRASDPEADELLRMMSDTLKGAQEFSFRGVTTADVVLENGPTVEYSTETQIRVRRPDRIASTIRGDLSNEDVWYNGTELTVFDVDRNEYAVESVPDTIDAMLDHIINAYGVTMPLADLVYSDPYTIVMADVQEGQYLGLHEVDGQACHHLAYRQEMLDWQIWIDAGEVAVPRKFVIIYLDQAGRPHYEALLKDWNLAAQLPDDTFEFHATTDPQLVGMDALVGPDAGD